MLELTGCEKSNTAVCYWLFFPNAPFFRCFGGVIARVVALFRFLQNFTRESVVLNPLQLRDQLVYFGLVDGCDTESLTQIVKQTRIDRC